MLVADGEHDAVAEVVDEGAAGGPAGQAGCLDHGVVVTESAQVAEESGPPAGGVADAPSPGGCVVQAAGCEVAGDSAAGRAGEVEPFGVL